MSTDNKAEITDINYNNLGELDDIAAFEAISRLINKRFSKNIVIVDHNNYIKSSVKMRLAEANLALDTIKHHLLNNHALQNGRGLTNDTK